MSADVHEDWWTQLRAKAIARLDLEQLVAAALAGERVILIAPTRLEAQATFDRARAALDNVHVFGAEPEALLERLTFAYTEEPHAI